MQQNSYIEAEDAYRRAVVIAADNNKMCNLGICLMKQGRISEARETLRRVKPAVADGPRGVDYHLKAYERAQQMLQDLESEMMNKGVDRIEQRKLFDAFLGSSAIWQPRPCRELNTAPISAARPQDVFADENVNSNIIANSLNTDKPVTPFGNSLNTDKPVIPFGNSLNIAAPPFYSSKFVTEPPIYTNHLTERTRSGNVASLNRGNEIGESWKPLMMEPRSQPNSPKETGENEWRDLLPDSKDCEDAILAAVLGSGSESGKMGEMMLGKFRERLTRGSRVFKRLHRASSSPRA